MLLHDEMHNVIQYYTYHHITLSRELLDTVDTRLSRGKVSICQHHLVYVENRSIMVYAAFSDVGITVKRT